MYSEQSLVTRKSKSVSIGMVNYHSESRVDALINLRHVYVLGLSDDSRNLKHLVARLTGAKDIKIIFFPYAKKKVVA